MQPSISASESLGTHPASAVQPAATLALPQVSAIIIFLNGEAFIAEAIESVLAQTYQNLELLLVDDGSSDGSPAIAALYADQYPDRIRVLQHPGHANRGMSASRNLGARHARGQYLAFLDSDDVWLPEKTEQQIAIALQHPQVGLIYGRTQIWHSWEAAGPAAPSDYYYSLGVRTESVHQAPSLLGTLLENRFQSPTTCNAMISRQAFEQLGGFEESFRTMYEDQAFFAKLYLRFPIYVSSSSWARYRQHSGNSGNHFSQSAYYRDRAKLMSFVMKYTGPQFAALDKATRGVLKRESWRANNPMLATAAMRLRVRRNAMRKWLKQAAGRIFSNQPGQWMPTAGNGNANQASS